jgi:hypothetical protein
MKGSSCSRKPLSLADRGTERLPYIIRVNWSVQIEDEDEKENEDEPEVSMREGVRGGMGRGVLSCVWKSEGISVSASAAHGETHPQNREKHGQHRRRQHEPRPDMPGFVRLLAFVFHKPHSVTSRARNHDWKIGQWASLKNGGVRVPASRLVGSLAPPN